MAVSYTATIGGYDYGFDFVDQRIDVDDRIIRMSVESLYRAIQEAQASSVGIVWPCLAVASGLDQLAEGITTFITVVLLDDWEVNTLLVTGKFEVAGGNLIREDGEDPFRDNPLITYINFISQAGVRATFSTGSGLSADQDAKLMSLPETTLTSAEKAQIDIIEATSAAIAAGQITSEELKALLLKRANTISDGRIVSYVAGDDTTVDVTYNADGVPVSEEIVP